MVKLMRKCEGSELCHQQANPQNKRHLRAKEHGFAAFLHVIYGYQLALSEPEFFEP